ncbi:MAG: AmmeMemoRadiSam system protein B, partial [Bacteroidales bacterium]|nr:AmmeMemoRadiSam system protein B [Bacteroidales bacterium]
DSLINRKPAVAGTFYPGNRYELEQEISRLFAEATPGKKLNHVVAVISPHAGYVYSGVVAASAFNQLSGETHYDNVFLIGSSHRASYDGAALYCQGHFIMPSGMVKVNIALSQKLTALNPDVFRSMPEAHAQEHSLEVQLPFLQHLYGDNLQIVPILIGTHKAATIKKIAEALKPYFNGKNLFVISTDFSHYPVYDDACLVDEATANAIVKNSSAEFRHILEFNEAKAIPGLATSICGWTSTLALLEITESIPGTQYHKIRYMNSGDARVGDKDRVVGYYAIAVTLKSKAEEQVITGDSEYKLTDKEKTKLLQLARTTIRQYLDNNEIPEVNTEGFTQKMLAASGAFVTLTIDGRLRGCIGRFEAEEPLYKIVQEMAVSAATRDYRFSKLTKEELAKAHIEISVLTPMKRVASPGEIVLGKHGIYIKKGNRGGTFLPQVASQTNWTVEEFLGHCARDKAGIGWDGWKDAEIFTYEAYVFGE